MSFRLKVELLCYGCWLTDAAKAALPSYRSGATTVRDYPTTSGLVLRLPGDRYVNSRVEVIKPPHFFLDHRDEGFAIVDGDRVVPVEVFPPADYARQNARLASGKSIRLLANTHADRVRLTPIHGCGLSCDFCNFPGMKYRMNTSDELEEALRIALADSIIRPAHVLVSGGSPRELDKDYMYLNDVYEQLPARFDDVRFDAMLAPRTLHLGEVTGRKYANFARFLRKAGYHALSINLELYGEMALNTYARDKGDIGRDRYLQFIERAVEEFGPGEVRSMLIVGVEDDEETLRGVDALASRGALVELSPFNAFPGTVMGSHPEPTPERLIALYERASEIADKRGMPLGYFCGPCGHNIL